MCTPPASLHGAKEQRPDSITCEKNGGGRLSPSMSLQVSMFPPVCTLSRRSRSPVGSRSWLPRASVRTPASLHGVKGTGQIKDAAIASEKNRGGDLSPSVGIKFSDVFYGWDAFQKVQVAGWLLIVAFGGVTVNTLFTFTDR